MAKTQHRVVGALVVGVVAISFAAIFFRKADPTHPLAAACIRLLLAGALLLPMIVRAALKGRLPRRIVLLGIGAGFFYAIHFGSWVTSLTLTTIAASVTLVTATPLLLALASLVSGRDRPDRRHWISIGLAVVGVGIIGGVDAFRSDALTGDALALLGAAAMAGYLLLARHAGEDVDVWAFMGIAAIVGGVSLWGTAAWAGIPIEAANNSAFGYLLLAALVPQLIGHAALTWSLRSLRPTIVGIATVGEPVGATLLGVLWLGEGVPWAVGIGCMVTILAVIVGIWTRVPMSPQNSTP
jgi:drug/metabolite transporter (DMT)-like permease